MPRVAKPRAAKGKAARKEEAAGREDLDLSAPAPAAPPAENDERAEHIERSRTAAPVPQSTTEPPKNGENDTEMVLRPPTKPVETSESDTEHERRERRVTGAETAPALKINIAEI